VRIHQIPLDSNWTLILFAVAVLSVYWEMCRPGMVIPGIAGLTLAVLAGIKLGGETRSAIRAWVAIPVLSGLALISALLVWIAIQAYFHKRIGLSVVGRQ
jgi:membrane-bound ClpP family serine protease